ncbi:hypothetical protein CFB40_25440 [Burkholderia sp. AU31652]|nr:hypothetical protein CFB40_25440 [Burkholderia sp. AU31652]
MRPLFRRSACITLARTARCAAACGTRCSCISSPSGAAGSPARRRACAARLHVAWCRSRVGAATASPVPSTDRRGPRAHVMKCTSSRSIARDVRACASRGAR